MEEKKQFGRRRQRRRRRSWPLLLLPVVLVLCLAAAYWVSGYTFPQEPTVEYPLQKIPVTVTGAPQDGEPAAEPESAAMPWYLTLVNRWNPLPETYEITLAEIPGGEKVDERIYEPLMEMLEAAKEDNWDQLPMVVSGYRTLEKQKSLYNDKIREYQKQGYSVEEAAEMAKEWVATASINWALRWILTARPMTSISGCRKTVISTASFFVIQAARPISRALLRKSGITAMLEKKRQQRFTSSKSAWKSIWNA